MHLALRKIKAIAAAAKAVAATVEEIGVAIADGVWIALIIMAVKNHRHVNGGYWMLWFAHFKCLAICTAS